jgi:uncharacterized membrane protein (UPF0127 family)
MRCSASSCIHPILAGAMLAMGAAVASAAQDNALRQLHIGQQVLRVEVAATPQQRQQGLMGRTRLAVNGGMLFVFDKADRHCFWMRNTPLPLSIAFIDAVGRIVEIADMQAYDDTRHCPASDVRYALELAQGGFLQRGIAPGAQITGLP